MPRPGALVRAADYLAALRRRTELIARTAHAFERFDLLLSAAAPGPAPLLREQRADEGFAVPFLTTPANVAAVPAAVVCGGFSSAGLPLGVQIMGPAWGDALVLRLAHHIERDLGTRTRRPALYPPSEQESGREPAPLCAENGRAGKGRQAAALSSPGRKLDEGSGSHERAR